MKKLLLLLIIASALFWYYWIKTPTPPVRPTPEISATSTPAVIITPPDPRIASLTAFFEHYNAPTPYYINDYLNAADKYNLDYRLVPAISVQESSAGRHACGYNFWGFGSCKGYNFRSVAEGIDFVSSQLADGHYYRGKTIDQKLRAYNPNSAYAGKVEQLMKEIQ